MRSVWRTDNAAMAGVGRARGRAGAALGVLLLALLFCSAGAFLLRKCVVLPCSGRLTR